MVTSIEETANVDAKGNRNGKRKYYSTVSNTYKWKAVLALAFNLSLFLLLLAIIHLASPDQEFPQLTEVCSQNHNCRMLGDRATVVGSSVAISLFANSFWDNKTGVLGSFNANGDFGFQTPLLFASNVDSIFGEGYNWIKHEGTILRHLNIDGGCLGNVKVGEVRLGSGFYLHARVLTPIMGRYNTRRNII